MRQIRGDIVTGPVLLFPPLSPPSHFSFFPSPVVVVVFVAHAVISRNSPFSIYYPPTRFPFRRKLDKQREKLCNTARGRAEYPECAGYLEGRNKVIF